MAAIAQLGERQTEDLKVPGSIPGGGMEIKKKYFIFLSFSLSHTHTALVSLWRNG